MTSVTESVDGETRVLDRSWCPEQGRRQKHSAIVVILGFFAVCASSLACSDAVDSQPALLVMSGVETGDDGGTNAATVGAGELLVVGSCVAFKVDESGQLFTVVWANGAVSWTGGNEFSVTTSGETKTVRLGQPVELGGSEIPADVEIPYITPPAQDCPPNRFGAGDATAVSE